MNCTKCDQPISEERLEALPDTKVCVACSDVKKVKGLVDYAHKTGGHLVMLPDDEEQQRLAFRCFRRAR